MATVTYDHATRTYPKSDRPAVDDLSLDIQDGEFLVLDMEREVVNRRTVQLG